MSRKEMVEILAMCVARGEISDEAADAVLNEFEDYTLRNSIPSTYAEIDYGDRDDPEAADGMDFLIYKER